MKTEAKTQIRIEGHRETDELIDRILKASEKRGIPPTTEARILIREALDAREQKANK
jgi:hypothetical protein